MKKIIAAAVLFTLGYAFAQTKITRMESLGEQQLTRRTVARYFHDKDGGREFVCFYSETDAPGVYNNITQSCVETGRQWK
jgi:hypothetical protein